MTLRFDLTRHGRTKAPRCRRRCVVQGVAACGFLAFVYAKVCFRRQADANDQAKRAGFAVRTHWRYCARAVLSEPNQPQAETAGAATCTHHCSARCSCIVSAWQPLPEPQHVSCCFCRRCKKRKSIPCTSEQRSQRQSQLRRRVCCRCSRAVGAARVRDDRSFWHRQRLGRRQDFRERSAATDPHCRFGGSAHEPVPDFGSVWRCRPGA